MFNTSNGASRNEDVCMILDIGNGSIGGSYVRFKKGEKPEIIYSVRLPIHIPEKPSSAHLFEKMTKLLSQAVDNLAKHGSMHHDFQRLQFKDIKHVFCIFSSPWYVSKTKLYRIERRSPAPVTEDFVQNLLDREAAELETVLEKEKKADLKFIEQKVIRTKLNGYDTKYPYSQAARSIELGVFMSMAPAVVLNKVRSIVSKRFNAHHIVFHSFALMSYSIIEDLFPNVQNYLFLDVTAEVTEVAVVRRNLISETISVPNGRNLLMRAIAKKYKVSPDIAATYMKLYNAGNAERSLKEGIDEAIRATEAEWKEGFGRALAEASKNRNLPAKIFVTMDEDVAPVFTRFLNSMTYSVDGEDVGFEVTVMNKNILAHFCSFGRSGKEDAFLAIESVYFNKIFHM